MKWFFFFIFLFLSIILETTVTTLPLVFIVLFCFVIVMQSAPLLFWSFFAGILLDALTLHTLGESSLFFLVFFAVVFLYERRFEIQSIKFVVLFSFLGNLLYGLLVKADYVFIQALIGMIFSISLFTLLKKLVRKEA